MNDAFGQILSNYQAALHLLEETATEVELQRVAAEVFAPVSAACVRSPGLERLAQEIVAGPAGADVAAERQRIAATHSRLIRRRPAVHEETAGRLAALATTTHSAGALFMLLRRSASNRQGVPDERTT
jgi:hypothetical protein